MTTTLDLRGDYARLNPPKDLPPLEFDLSGAHALVSVIRPVTDARRDEADRVEQARQLANNEREIAHELGWVA